MMSLYNSTRRGRVVVDKAWDAAAWVPLPNKEVQLV